MTAVKRVVWTKSESQQVAYAVYRQLQSSNHNVIGIDFAAIEVQAIERAQRLVLHIGRCKQAITTVVASSISLMVQAIAADNHHPKLVPRKEVTIPVVQPFSATLEAQAVLSRPLTIDLQIRSLVRTELISQQPALLSRIEGLLSSHERTISGMLEQHERRMIQFWSSPPPAEHTQSTLKVERSLVKPRKFRVLVACLRKDQHRLITDRLTAVAEYVDVVILDQEDGFIGVKSEYFNKVLVLTKFIGHSHFDRIQSVFRKDQIVACGGAALTAASVILKMLEDTQTAS